MGKLKTVVVKYWKVYAAALVIAVICDLIGTVKLNIGIGTLTIFPMVFATIIGGILGPDAFKLFKVPESRLGGSLVLVVLAPFMAKNGGFGRRQSVKTCLRGTGADFTGIRESGNHSVLAPHLHFFWGLRRRPSGPAIQSTGIPTWG